MAKELLTDVAIRNTKPQEKDTRLNDGSGLYLLVKPNGAKWWRFDYTINSKRKTLSVGVYPIVTLAEARKRANEARSLVSKNIDPSDERKALKVEKKIDAENQQRIEDGLPAINSFEHIALEWYEKRWSIGQKAIKNAH